MAINRHFLLLLALLLLAGPGSALAAGDAQNGKRVFKKCAACHRVEPGKKEVGHSLHDVIAYLQGFSG